MRVHRRRKNAQSTGDWRHCASYHLSVPDRLFVREDLETYAFNCQVDAAASLRGLGRLARLQSLFRTAYWRTFNESNVEQSFVERVFGDVFGYETLLGSESD